MHFQNSQFLLYAQNFDINLKFRQNHENPLFPHHTHFFMFAQYQFQYY